MSCSAARTSSGAAWARTWRTFSIRKMQPIRLSYRYSSIAIVMHWISASTGRWYSLTVARTWIRRRIWTSARWTAATSSIYGKKSFYIQCNKIIKVKFHRSPLKSIKFVFLIWLYYFLQYSYYQIIWIIVKFFRVNQTLKRLLSTSCQIAVSHWLTDN